MGLPSLFFVTVGRPTLLTDELQAALESDLETGNYLSTAAIANGISYRSVRRWVKQGEKDLESGRGETQHAIFCQTVKRARRRGEKRLIARVAEGGPGWQGAAWILERTMHKRYGRRLMPEEKDAIAKGLASLVKQHREKAE